MSKSRNIKKSTKLSFYKNLDGIFTRIESALFISLCLILIVSSRLNNKIIDSLSMKLVGYSSNVSGFISLPLNLIVNSTLGLQDLINSDRRNAVLNKENEQLKSLYINSLNIHQENQELKAILRYTGAKSKKYIVARLISQPYQTYSKNVIIDAGSLQNIKEGDMVAGNNTLIGRINQVDENKSRVLLITDINSHIPIMVAGSGAKGILVGNNSNLMEILYLDKDVKINKGDLVFTSGDGDYLPPGFLVGVIKDFDNGYASVESLENAKNLDLVSVINY